MGEVVEKIVEEVAADVAADVGVVVVWMVFVPLLENKTVTFNNKTLSSCLNEFLNFLS